MKFSVIVPFYNEEKYIEQCLQKLLSQDFPKEDYEIIFVDNLSDDKSAEIVKKHPEITYLREVNPNNVYAARNTGVKKARGEIIAFTDADTFVPENWLTIIYQKILAGFSIILSRTEPAPTTSRCLNYLTAYEVSKAEIVFKKLNSCYWYTTAGNMAIHKSLFDRYGLFTEGYNASDTAFLHRILRLSPSSKVIHTPDIIANHQEITSFYIWLKKMWYYGKINQRINLHEKNYKELSLKLKLTIAFSTVKKQKLKIMNLPLFFLVLSISSFVYFVGTLRGRCEKNG